MREVGGSYRDGQRPVEESSAHRAAPHGVANEAQGEDARRCVLAMEENGGSRKLRKVIGGGERGGGEANIRPVGILLSPTPNGDQVVAREGPDLIACGGDHVDEVGMRSLGGEQEVVGLGGELEGRRRVRRQGP